MPVSSSRVGSNSCLPKCHRLKKSCKFSLARQSTKRPGYGNTCPRTGKTVSNATPWSPRRPRSLGLRRSGGRGWTPALTAAPGRGSHTPDPIPGREPGNLSSLLGPTLGTTLAPQPARLLPVRSGLPLHSATSSLLAGLAAPPPPPRRPALRPPPAGPRAAAPRARLRPGSQRRRSLRGPPPAAPRPALPAARSPPPAAARAPLGRSGPAPLSRDTWR